MGARIISEPLFLIIGAQRCATTALYSWLRQHPGVVAAFRKEVHFFDLHYDRGVDWYRRQLRIGRTSLSNYYVGEASPYYLFHPCAPERVKAVAPHARIIVSTRLPMERAYSHYCHEVRLGCEHLSFPDALSAEAERLKGAEYQFQTGEINRSFAHQHYSYQARGDYSRQLDRWLQYFDRRQVLTIRFEDLLSAPLTPLRSVLDFLGLTHEDAPRWTPKK